MTESDEFGHHFIGYFSKEKRSDSYNNVSCICTLPVYQRKGYGNFLIDFSYLLSKEEGICGTPERPLSDLGLVAYKNYWRQTIIRTLVQQKQAVSIHRTNLIKLELSEITRMTIDDICLTLHQLDAIYKDDNGQYRLRYVKRVYENEIARINSKGLQKLKPELLKWSPFLFKRLGQLQQNLRE